MAGLNAQRGIFQSKNMKIEIDQSGKIEDTSRLTIVAYSNGKSRSLMITSKDKKSLLSIFRKINQTRVFISKVFAAAIFLLIKPEYKKIDTIVIDNEYPGHEKVIKGYLKQYIDENGYISDNANIHFQSIGKKSKAHDVAWKANHYKKADIKATDEDILKIIFK